MPCSYDEAVCFWTYAPRLSLGSMHLWSIRQQIEAFDELDVMAAVTLAAGLRRRCLEILTTRPDIAVLSKLGCAPDGEEFLALFEDEYTQAPAEAPRGKTVFERDCEFAEMLELQTPGAQFFTSHEDTARLLNVLPVPPLPWDTAFDPACTSGSPVFDGDRLVSVYYW